MNPNPKSEDFVRWSGIVSAGARGEEPSEPDRRHARAFEAANADLGPDRALFSALGRLAEPRGAEADDAALVRAVLARAAHEQSVPEPPVRSRRRSSATTLGMVGVALALAAVAVLLARGTLRIDRRGSSATAETAESAQMSAARAGDGGAAVEREEPRSGTGVVVPLAREPVAAPEILAPVDPASDPEPRAPIAADADAMLRRAQHRLAVDDARGAMLAYEELVRAHPRSEEAKTARVSLGRLLLARGRAAEARRQFERYLEHGGALAEEASWGRVGALQRLGQVELERAAIAEFLARYPRSIYAPRLQERSIELEAR